MSYPDPSQAFTLYVYIYYIYYITYEHSWKRELKVQRLKVT